MFLNYRFNNVLFIVDKIQYMYRKNKFIGGESVKFENIEILKEKLRGEYKTLLDIIDNKIIIIDNDFNILFINKKGMVGLDDSYLMKHCSILKTNNCNSDNCCVKRYLNGLEPKEIICRDGTIDRVSVSRFFDKQGKPQGFIIVSTDITEIDKMKQELLISEEIYKLALTQSRTTLWEYDVKEKKIQQLFSPQGGTIGILDGNVIYRDIPNSLVENNIVSKEDGKRIVSLCKEIENGKPETEIELKMRGLDGVERWVKLKCNTIFDVSNKAIKSIGIAEDITDIIELKTRYQIEREQRETLSEDAMIYLEANLDENKVVTRRILKNNYLEYYSGSSYDRFIDNLSDYVIKSEKGKLCRELKRKNLVELYSKGIRNHDFEYQLYNKKSKAYQYVKISILLLNINNSVYGCIYIIDINDSKEENLELQKKAELDPLTGLYNRKIIESKINQIIKEFPEAWHALMILDVDNFKAINDNMGHLYGDALLCEIANKIKTRFRNDDLIARLGGDEYLILMKNIYDQDLAVEKAKDLCKVLSGTYGTSKIKIDISVSIGVALYPQCGSNFDMLYHCGDIALYKVKNTTKNGVCLYDKKMELETNIIKNRETIVEDRKPKNFSENVGVYIFRILYNCQDINETVTAVLELLGMHYNMTRSALFIKKLGSQEFILQNIWTNNNKPSSSIKSTSSTKLDKFISLFDEAGMLWIEDINSDEVDPFVKEFYKGLNIKTAVNYLIKNGQNVIGIIALEYDHIYRFSLEEKEVITTACAIIGTFVLKEYQEEEKNRYLNAIKFVLDSQNTAIYIINPDNYTLIYYNNRIKEIFNDISSDDKCYKKFRDLDEPCQDCPLLDMSENDKSYKKIIYNQKLNTKLEITAKRIRWFDEQKALALTSIDITNYYQK